MPVSHSASFNLFSNIAELAAHVQYEWLTYVIDTIDYVLWYYIRTHINIALIKRAKFILHVFIIFCIKLYATEPTTDQGELWLVQHA